MSGLSVRNHILNGWNEPWKHAHTFRTDQERKVSCVLRNHGKICRPCCAQRRLTSWTIIKSAKDSVLYCCTRGCFKSVAFTQVWKFKFERLCSTFLGQFTQVAGAQRRRVSGFPLSQIPQPPPPIPNEEVLWLRWRISVDGCAKKLIDVHAVHHVYLPLIKWFWFPLSYCFDKAGPRPVTRITNKH